MAFKYYISIFSRIQDCISSVSILRQTPDPLLNCLCNNWTPPKVFTDPHTFRFKDGANLFWLCAIFDFRNKLFCWQLQRTKYTGSIDIVRKVACLTTYQFWKHKNNQTWHLHIGKWFKKYTYAFLSNFSLHKMFREISVIEVNKNLKCINNLIA